MTFLKTLFRIIRLQFIQYKTAVLYTGSSVIKSFATVIVGFIIARYVTPSDFGIWSMVNLGLTYFLFMQAGLINGLNLELPFLYGKGDKYTAKMMAGTVQTFIVISSFLILLGGLIYFIFYPEQNFKIKIGIFTISIIIGLNYYQNYLLSTFRSNNSFIKLSYIQIVEACMNLGALVLVAYYSYYGLLIKSALVLFIYVLLLHFSRPIKVGLIWNNDAFWKVLKVGFPIFILVYIDSISSTIDKLWILKYSDIRDVGLYSFGLYSLSLFSLFSASIASYIYPKMTYNYGKNNNKHILWNFVKKITIILLVIQTPLVIVGYFIIPVAINHLFPNYVNSIVVMQILLLAGLFKGAVVGANALWSIKKWKYMISYQVIYSFLLVTSTFIGVNCFYNKIEGVAYGVLFANALNLFSGIYLTYKATHCEW